ncbi:endonuclease domain-containing protein [Microbacterium sp. MEC084]|uniref:endonuclease domain-containing protein n=1 Tax=Microbacterium sp. MEC084 TaxID=1963027 RepID=UPI001E44259B|nr:DUF559 domain-containing protein [Microbacterium sp. MEC084]
MPLIDALIQAADCLGQEAFLVACQVRIRHVGRVDFVLAGRVILEVDGKENHDGPSERHKDLRRDAIAISLGFTPLRFDYSLVMYEWPIVERAILAALSRPQGLR